MILIAKAKTGFLPVHDADLPIFMHCCAGMIEVKDISFWMPVFAAHGIQVMIQDETLEQHPAEALNEDEQHDR